MEVFMKFFNQKYKSFISIMLLLVMIFSAQTPTPTYAETEQPERVALFVVDGELVRHCGTILLDGILYIPARTLFSNLGSLHSWQAGTSVEPAVFVLANQHIVFNPDSNIVYVNDEIVTFESSSFIKDGHLYIPLIESALLTGQDIWHIILEGRSQIVEISPYNRFGEDVFLFINALNANAMLRSMRDQSADEIIARPASFSRNFITSIDVRGGLNSFWNITSREGVFQAIDNLYTVGHNTRYIAEHRAAGTTSPWGDTGILGWDLGRVAQIASHAFIAGYITFDEFIQLSLPAAITLQYHFDSWEQKSENFLYGAAFWLRGQRYESTELEVRQRAHDRFMYGVIDILPPWDMDLQWALDLPPATTLGALEFTTNIPQLQPQTQSQPETELQVQSETPSAWAVEFVNQAVALGLVPQNLQSSYIQPTTRAEFAALAVALYETATGNTIAGRVAFNDTDDVNVQKAGYLGVVTGVGEGNFNPNGQLTREQAAVMLARLASAIGQPLPQSAPTFADNSQISSWAFDAVGQAQAAGIMGGVGDNQFAPSGDYTREQSIVTILRLFELLN